MKALSALILCLISQTTVLFSQDYPDKNQADSQHSWSIETFSFPHGGIETKGKIYLPVSYATSIKLPVVYLIDFTEQHFKLATDEFERVIEGVQKIQNFDAMVVSLEDIPDIDAEPHNYLEHYQLYKNMATHVDRHYKSNTSRTLIGKGSESGIVLMTLFQEDLESSVFDNYIATDPSPLYADSVIKIIEENDFPQAKSNKKLHLSFSTTNDRQRCIKLIDLISEAQYPWLQFRSKEYTDSNYENTYPISFAEGLAYIFNTK